MVGWLRIELRLNRLWVDCFTIKLSAHVWRKMWESNSLTVSLRWQISNLLHYRPAHLPNSGTQWRNQTSTSAFVAQRDIHFTNRVSGTSWQIRTADLLRVKETLYHWVNEAHNMAEDGGVEPHPISENPVFKAGRSTNTAASSSIIGSR